MLQLAEILTEALADVTDGAYSEADQIAPRMRRVAHEVALQLAGFLSAHQLIVREREMIHADVAIASGGQLLDREPQQLEPLRGTRQRGGIDATLRLEQPGKVRIAVHRQAIGPRRH